MKKYKVTIKRTLTNFGDVELKAKSEDDLYQKFHVIWNAQGGHPYDCDFPREGDMEFDVDEWTEIE